QSPVPGPRTKSAAAPAWRGLVAASEAFRQFGDGIGFRSHRLGHQIRRAQVGVERARVGPPAVQVGEGHGTFLDIGVIDVGDFQFAAPRRHQRLDLVENTGVVHVKAGNGEVGFRFSRLFLNSGNVVAGDFGHAEALGVRDFLEQDVGALALPAETVGGRQDVALDDVIAQHHANLLPVGEVLGQRQGVGDTAFAFLVGVVDVLQAELLAVGQEAQKFARIPPSGDHQNLLNPGIHEGLDRVVDHGPVIDRQQMLIGDFCEREQSASRATSQDDALHKFLSYRNEFHGRRVLDGLVRGGSKSAAIPNRGSISTGRRVPTVRYNRASPPERAAAHARAAGRDPGQSAGETSRYEPERISQGPRNRGEVAPVSWEAPVGAFHPASAPDYVPLAQMRQLQLQRLRAVVRRAYDCVELFRQRLDERHFPPDGLDTLADIRHLPFTTKADLRDTYPFGLFASPMRDVVRVHASSGTTGKPIVVAYTQPDLDVWTSVMVRAFAACGLDHGDVVQNAYGYGLFTGGL